jgi:hypothetical protein
MSEAAGRARAGDLRPEPASFRDPDARVLYGPGDRVLRALSERGAREWRHLVGTTFFHRLTGDGRLVGTRPAGEGEAGAAVVAAAIAAGWSAVLEHDRVPFVSYPFEWTFGMLRDAAILHLEALLDALVEGMTTKDGSAYNVQWRGTSPVFIDISSFTPAAGGPWPGYRQFCETFLNPLLLQARRSVDFQPWLRGRLEGIPVGQMRRLLPGRDLVRPGVAQHVVLHDVLQRRIGDGSNQATARLADAGFDTAVTRAVVERLLRIVRRLDWRVPSSAWSRYRHDRPYSAEDLREKTAFVTEAVRAARPGLVWDLGCNDGIFARAAAGHADYVVAMDADHPSVERLYRSLRARGDERILPLVVDLADPTPGLGWRGEERRALADRARPEVVLCLALVHHLAIGANLDLDGIVGWLHSLGGRVVVEFAGPDDPMVRRLLANAPADHAGYTRAAFEASVARRFAVCRRLRLPSGTRTLYDLAPQ